MKNLLNDIKSKIYRSRCNEKIKINRINKMKKNIKTFNEKNVAGIKKIDKILGNDPSDEIINQENENDEEIYNFFPPSSKMNNNNKSFNQYEENEYNPNPNYDEKENNNNNMKVNDEEPYMIKNYNVNEFNDYINNIESNSFINNNKRKSLGDNSVNLFELNQKIKNSTDKLSLNSFERKIMNSQIMKI